MCFDYNGHDKIFLDKTIQDRIYLSWQLIHKIFKEWEKEKPGYLINYLNNSEPDLINFNI